MARPNLIDCVIHWKKKLDKNPDDDDIILNVVRKLSKIPITPEILEATHIGKTIRNLSKRTDSVGENALTVLNKWRKIFMDLESSKHKGISNNNHKEKCLSKQNLTQFKTAGHHERESSHELKEKHKKYSSHHISSKQLSEKHHNANSSSISSHPFDKSRTKYLNDMNLHHSKKTDIACNSGSPETHLLDDKSNITSLNDCHEMSSLKRKLTEEKVEIYKNSLPKKIKLENHSSLHSEEKKKHKCSNDIANKAESSSKNFKDKQSSSSHSKEDKYYNSKAKSELEKSKSKVKIQSSDGFTASSVSFEDCLGFSDIAQPVKKKKGSKSQSSTEKLPSDSTQYKQKVDANTSSKKLSDNVKVSKKSSHSSKEKLPGNVPKTSSMFSTSEVNPPSRAITQSSSTMSHNQSSNKMKKESLTNEDVIKFTSSRKEKTAIYSGRKSCKTFPSLAQCCYRVLIENIDCLGKMGDDTPYELLKPILEKCTPNQLFDIEKYNPHLLDDTNELWEIHCKRDYKLLSPLEHETWRDVYLRGFDEREEKLKHIAANISASMSKATPVRQVKLAFIDSDVKPPREVLRRQAKHRLLESYMNVKPATMAKVNVKKVTNIPCSTVSSQSFVADKKGIVKTNEILQREMPNKNLSPKGNAKNVAAPVVESTASNKDIIALSLAARKPKIAPLMAKTLKTMKQCFRR